MSDYPEQDSNSGNSSDSKNNVPLLLYQSLQDVILFLFVVYVVFLLASLVFERLHVGFHVLGTGFELESGTCECEQVDEENGE